MQDTLISFLAESASSGFLSVLSTWLMGILAAVAVLLLFGLTVFVHELGHFVAARLCGLRVDAFSIGFGKAVWQRRVNGTRYKLGWIPFGGYVALPQLDPSGMQIVQGENGGQEEIPPAAWWKRIIVSLFGPLGNIALAALLAVIVWALPPPGIPQEYRYEGAVVGMVSSQSPAFAAGLRNGDDVLSVNGAKVGTWGEFGTEVHLKAAGDTVALSVSNILDGVVQEIHVPVTRNDLDYYAVDGVFPAHFCVITNQIPGSPSVKAGLKVRDVLIGINGKPVVGYEQVTDLIKNSNGHPVELKYYRNGKVNTVSVTPAFIDAPAEEGGPRYMIGTGFDLVTVGRSPWMRYRIPGDQLGGDFASIGRVLNGLTRKEEAARVGKALGGPIVIMTSMWYEVLAGLAGILAFVRFLNINLAVINLLPLPVLDGGHIVFALYRAIFRREMPAKLIAVLVNFFAVLLIGLFLFITYRDILLVGHQVRKNNLPKTAAAEPVEPAQEDSDAASEPAEESAGSAADPAGQIVP